MAERIAQTVVHYSRHDPRRHTGGVETFARNLERIFHEVMYMTPADRNVQLVRERKLPVICDNHMVLDWPSEIRVIGFQHGMAARKVLVTRSFYDARLAIDQWRAGRRPNTLWVACARWIAKGFERLSGNRPDCVIYHPTDLRRFDGRLENQGSRLILHDARTAHKGRHLIARLARALPQWRFEPLACKPEQVPDRMRSARAFIHLSRYEGNSIVCNEAMAMNLPCLFSHVGLMLDNAGCDVSVVPRRYLYFRPAELLQRVRGFLAQLDTKSYQPRDWVAENASFDRSIEQWQNVLDRLRSTT